MNDGAFFVLPESSYGQVDNILVVRDFDMSVFVLGKNFRYAYEMEESNMRALHAVVNFDANACFLFSYAGTLGYFYITKYSLDTLPAAISNH